MLSLNRSPRVASDPELPGFVNRLRHGRIGMSRTFLLAVTFAVAFATGSPLAGQERPPIIIDPIARCDATCVGGPHTEPRWVCEYVETVTVIVVHANGDVTSYTYDEYECELQ